MAHIQRDTLLSFDTEESSVSEAKEHLTIFKTTETAQQCKCTQYHRTIYLVVKVVKFYVTVFYHNFFFLHPKRNRTNHTSTIK